MKLNLTAALLFLGASLALAAPQPAADNLVSHCTARTSPRISSLTRFQLEKPCSDKDGFCAANSACCGDLVCIGALSKTGGYCS